MNDFNMLRTDQLSLFSMPDPTFVRRTYKALLGREPDANGLDHYLLSLKIGKDRIDVIRDIYRSPEAEAVRNPLKHARDDSHFIELAYRRNLFRLPDLEGLKNYHTLLKQGCSREEIMNMITDSDEAKAELNEYKELNKSLAALVRKKSIKYAISNLFRGRSAPENVLFVQQISSLAESLSSTQQFLATKLIGALDTHSTQLSNLMQDVTELKSTLDSKTPKNKQNSPNATQPSTDNQYEYLHHRNSQQNYLNNYIDAGIERIHLDLIREVFNAAIKKSDKIIIYPISYPSTMTQRPDHLLRYLSSNNYICIIIEIDGNPPKVQKISETLYHTNLFAGVISYFRYRPITLYLTYPLFAYLGNYFPRRTLIYDVLDDLTVFSLHCNAMRADHEHLLSTSDITLFSSEKLLEKNKKFTKSHSIFAPNGVWVNDFSFEKFDPALRQRFRRYPGEFVLGYHGAISELLDWPFLERMLYSIPNLRLVLVGPVVNFASDSGEDLLGAQRRVLASAQVTHVPTVQYTELKYYLAGFDAAIIPFIINKKTNPVLPLKLFEYFASGLKVFATATETLTKYSPYATVADASKLLHFITSAAAADPATFGESDSTVYSTILHSIDWAAILSPLHNRLTTLRASNNAKQLRTRRVDIININFFNWEGDTVYKGGAERYVFDLATLLNQHGWKTRILQAARLDFSCDYQGVEVVGIATDQHPNMRELSRRYRKICQNADLIISSPADLACELWGLNVVAINHGIYWDHKFKQLSMYDIEDYRTVFDSLKNARSTVAVDTNFINWTRTFDYNLAKNIDYIPNYVDTALFCAQEKNFEDQIEFLYPRRLYEARGMQITLNAFSELLAKYPNIKLHLVGQADAEEGELAQQFLNRFPDQATWSEFNMENMWRAYNPAHVVLIPTMYSEGTSLSCLEAMATNNAIIASNVGGLPNLIINEFNGLLIKPDVEELINAIEILLGNRSLMKSLAQNAMQTVKAFSKKKWENRWMKVVEHE